MTAPSRRPILVTTIMGGAFIAAGVGLGRCFMTGCGHFHDLLDDEGTESFRASHGIGILACGAVLVLVLFLAGGCLVYGIHLLNKVRRQIHDA